MELPILHSSLPRFSKQSGSNAAVVDNCTLQSQIATGIIITITTIVVVIVVVVVVVVAAAVSVIAL
jgi:hypothetical protein